MRKSNDTRMKCPEPERLRGAIDIYNKSKSINLAAKFLGEDFSVTKRILTENNVSFDEYSGEGVTFLDKWVLLYGDKIANKMYQKYLDLQSVNTSAPIQTSLSNRQPMSPDFPAADPPTWQKLNKQSGRHP